VSSTDRTPAGIEPEPRPAGPEETIQEDPTGRAVRSEKADWTVTLFRSPAHFQKKDGEQLTQHRRPRSLSEILRNNYRRRRRHQPRPSWARPGMRLPGGKAPQ
jgi:hypothetical protein